MSFPRKPEAWPVGARVREIGPTIIVVPVQQERPARTGTVRRSLNVLAVVHWDNEPEPDTEHPSHDALALSTWLEPADGAAVVDAPEAPLSQSDARDAEPTPPTPAAALERAPLRLVPPTAPETRADTLLRLRLVSLGAPNDLSAPEGAASDLNPNPSTDPERPSR